MKRKGINYDVGVALSKVFSSRPTFDQAVARRELEIIKNDLHCNTVRISGTSIQRLALAAEAALELGLEVWLSPQLHDKSMEETLAYIIEAAKEAEALRRQWPRITFVVGCELTIFMQGILEGNNVVARLSSPSFRAALKAGAHNKPLNAFLANAVKETREVFKGDVSYASVPFEAVDWTLFDFVGVDHYREARNKDSYAATLTPYFAHNKPVVVTEFGCCTFKGAGDMGGRGWMIMEMDMDADKPPTRLNGDYVRDEHEQAQELASQLSELDKCGVEGAFVFTFVSPPLTHSDIPRQDLDMASYSLVTSYANHNGIVYPDMQWEPKESFQAVAGFFGKI
jgi:hypothetical protein